MSQEPVVVLIGYRAQPGREEVAVRELAALIATVQAEERDCLGITLLRDTADPARILLHEWWTSEEAFTGPHLTTPHLTAFRERAASLFTGPPETSFWRTAAAV